MAYVIGDDCIACGTCQGECPVEAISEGEKYSIRSILSIPISALSAVLALAYVPLRLSVWVNWFINQNKKPLNRAAFYFAYSVYLMSRICWAGA